MPFIENVSLANVKAGYHYDPGPSGILIQIVNPDADFPPPAFSFGDVHRFRFADTGTPGPDAIQEEDAEALVRILRDALSANRSIIVHCHAGVCRSGAVAEVGCLMGFQETGAFRAPNLLVKGRLLVALNRQMTQG